MTPRLLITAAAGLMMSVWLAVTPAWGAGVPLYPDLKTLPPRELRLDRVDVGGVSHSALRFSNTTWNDGEGRLEVRAQIDPTTKEGPALQRVQDTVGNYADYTISRIYYHAAHNHYHFDGWGEYQLWTRGAYDSWIASGRAIGNAQSIGNKTTSCIMDEEFIRQLASTPYPAVFPGAGCGQPNAQGLMVQGLSSGWGDTYDWSRAEQYVDVGTQTLPDGAYVLRSVADPTNIVHESPAKGDVAREGELDNEAITAFTVSAGQIVDSNPPDSPTLVVNHTEQDTTTPNVTVSVLGRDDVSGVDQVRLSNDGNQWKTFTYTGASASSPMDIAWNISDPAYGGTQAGGTHTVFAQVHDRAGNWSTSGSDTIDLRNGSISSYSAAVLADSPGGYWRLGETTGTVASDSAGGNPGSYRNGVALNATGLLASDPANPAATFDGVNDHVAIGDAAAISPTAKLSVEAWIKPTSVPAAGGWASVATKAESYSIQFNGPRLEFTVIQAGTRRRTQAPAGAIVAGQAYHVVGTYDGTFARLYINGAEAATMSLTGDASISSAPLTIGAWTATSEFMTGTIDEVAVYGTALSSARVQAHYAAGTSGPPEAVPAPSGLTATATSGKIDLRWTDNAANETGFTVQRDSDPGFPAPTSTSLPANTTTFSDTGLPVGRRYYYRVSARNATDTSGWSNVAGATTPDPVAAPSGLAATPVSPTRVDLQWLDNSTNETGFSVERSASSTFSSPTVTTLPPNATTYSDTSVSGANTYYYRVRATNASDGSTYSNTATATTPAPPLTAPTGLTATASSQTQVDLRWTDTTSTETGFVVERDTSAAFAAPTAFNAAANATTFSDTGLTASTTYYYRVRARDATQVSPNSNPANATTLATPPPPSNYVTTVRADSPAGYWRLGEATGTAAADQMGTNPGVYVNAPMLGQASLLGSDKANAAVGFDGSVDQVRVADSASLKLTSPFSLEAWIKPAALPAAGSFASVVTKENTYSIQFNGPRLEFTVIQSGSRKRLQAPAGAVVAGQTYHVVATYDGATRRLYLNGAEVINGPLTGAATTTTNPVMIATWDGRSEFLRGTVDEVAVYRTALAPARVAAHYNAGK